MRASTRQAGKLGCSVAACLLLLAQRQTRASLAVPVQKDAVQLDRGIQVRDESLHAWDGGGV